MATYSAIPDANLDPDSPAKSIDALALRDNPIAIAEGAAGAPRIENAAFRSVTTGAIESWVNGYGSSNLATASTSYTSDPGQVRAENVRCMVSGDITVSLSHSVSNNSEIAYARILKNGSLVVEWSTASTSSVPRTQDISIAFGDVISIQQRVSGGLYEALWNSLKITASKLFWVSASGGY